MMIAEPSIQSVFLVPMSGPNELGSATGFVVQPGSESYLITNWHVVSGRNPLTGQPLHSHGVTPDRLRVLYMLPPKADRVEWVPRDELTVDDAGLARWFEHPVFGRRVDVVALPLQHSGGAHLVPYDINQPDDKRVVARVADTVRVIGFPFGRTGGGAFGIWTTGTVASEPDVDFDDLPCFLIDARTREGQSGSPVIIYVTHGSAQLASGTTVLAGGQFTTLLGVYSGRINASSDLGVAWKARVIDEIVAGKKVGNGKLVP